jgi:hypothetical protein
MRGEQLVRHAPERRAQQCRDEADRRARALAGYVEAVGGVTAASETLGVSKQAISKALGAACTRPEPHPPLAGFMELEFLRCGDRRRADRRHGVRAGGRSSDAST